MAFDHFARKEESAVGVARRLKEEIDSWRPYAEALRQEDRETFREMMNSVTASYKQAIERAERGYDTEAVMMSILLNQQKTISWLSSVLKRMREESRSTPS
jgi:DNA repair protein RadC